MREASNPKLAVFRTDSGVTISFGEKTYFVDKSEPFYNIALKSLEMNDYVPFYVEVAKREGKGREFSESLNKEVARFLEEEGDEE